MTGKEQDRADDRMREEIARRSADARQLDDMIREVTARLLANARQADERNREEIAKLIAETGQFNVLRYLLVPTLAAAALMGATGVIVKLFF